MQRYHSEEETEILHVTDVDQIVLENVSTKSAPLRLKVCFDKVEKLLKLFVSLNTQRKTESLYKIRD